MMHENLKYAMRAGRDVMVQATISEVGILENMSDGTARRRLYITDGHTTCGLMVWGDAAHVPYRLGSVVCAGPVYWSGQWENFSLKRGGTITV